MTLRSSFLPFLFIGLMGCADDASPPGPVEPALPPSAIPDTAKRLIVVRSASWSATKGNLVRYERTASTWSQVGTPIAVVLGKNGVGWGRGLHGEGAPGELAGPVKAEGDGKAPAGVFGTAGVYGYDMTPPMGTQVPYVQLTDTWRCVDDSASSKYNEVFDSANVTSDWNSSETMLRPDELYTRVVVVDHNPPPAHAGGGSCIFLHVWRNPDSTTAGCTAMPLADLETVIAFLTSDTVIVQMEQSSYDKLADAWSLPK